MPDPTLLIPLGCILAVFLWGAIGYNSLVKIRNSVSESWSGIDTELKRRYDLIPNLVETVKGYARHEQETLLRVLDARNRAVASIGPPTAQARDENALIGLLRQLLVVVENYPQLKADRNFLELQRELANTEDRIQAARRFYNGNVRDLNNRIEVFPSNLIASVFRFTPAEFFEIEDTGMRAAPEVRL